MGSPGQGNVFDHVVEQSQIKATRSGFATDEIHNRFNMNPVSAATNQLKANYYSSIRPGLTGSQTVREWLNGTFADQYEFGMDVLMRIENRIPLR